MSKPFIWLQHALPQLGLTRFAGRVAASEKPWIRDRLIDRFVRAYNVDMDEAERDIGDFASFNDFFARSLKPGARPLADAATHVLCPADGEVSQLGTIRDGRIVQAKGHEYTVAELLGGDEALAARFHQGDFITIYLSPSDYHRVHMPAAGTLQSTSYVPGDLFSVNQTTAANVPGLFARNERLSCVFDSELGTMASVMVGAMIVAGIETVWGGRVEPPERGRGKRLHRETPGRATRLDAGAEMGRFLLGSTVVLLFEQEKIEFLPQFKPGSKTRMGEALARRL
ncbi:Phosphatidylserine decarboxylase [Alteripontixanthobacter maritimus]|uniref:Phosphatidylserine decarboxylase proenzyme n=1 Tax=Alteripontixanthobacter maritimus TaxID=2161824 RepID=A0A369QAG5_9SPHN|nr:archaetidylserine decarboxylase [Alteripontixanthobacter maritimus]RDC58878.1 Phosphatidylserine decarboxylase [Alteripontixanthobacter maritimus]RDC61330.1 Phosphatidylserine decarboxylase [Alteripontixanthobacter maritimus]